LCGPILLWLGYGSTTKALLLVIETLVDPGNFSYPTLALGMFQRQNLFVRPMKVIRNVRYLLIEPL